MQLPQTRLGGQGPWWCLPFWRLPPSFLPCTKNFLSPSLSLLCGSLCHRCVTLLCGNFPWIETVLPTGRQRGLKAQRTHSYRLRILENPQSPKVIEALKELLGEESSSSLALPGGDPSTCPVCPAQHAGCCGDAGLVSLHLHYGGLLWWTVFKPSMFL